MNYNDQIDGGGDPEYDLMSISSSQRNLLKHK